MTPTLPLTRWMVFTPGATRSGAAVGRATKPSSNEAAEAVFIPWGCSTIRNEGAQRLTETYQLDLMKKGLQLVVRYTVGYSNSNDGLLRAAYDCALSRMYHAQMLIDKTSMVDPYTTALTEQTGVKCIGSYM